MLGSMGPPPWEDNTVPLALMVNTMSMHALHIHMYIYIYIYM